VIFGTGVSDVGRRCQDDRKLALCISAAVAVQQRAAYAPPLSSSPSSGHDYRTKRGLPRIFQCDDMGM